MGSKDSKSAVHCDWRNVSAEFADPRLRVAAAVSLSTLDQKVKPQTVPDLSGRAPILLNLDPTQPGPGSCPNCQG